MTIPSESRLLALLRIFAENSGQLLYKLAPQLAAVYAVPRESQRLLPARDRRNFGKSCSMLMVIGAW